MENPPQIDCPRKIVCNEDREMCNVAVVYDFRETLIYK